MHADAPIYSTLLPVINSTLTLLPLPISVGSSGPSRRRPEYQRQRNLRHRPTSAEYQLWEIFAVGWGYQHIRHHYTLAGPTMRRDGIWTGERRQQKTG